MLASIVVFFFSSRRRHTRCALVTGVQTCALPIYVRTEMNRVQRFAEGDGKKRNNVGFALQILQRRLASSPAAIYQSLKRRRERLENELGEARLAAKGRRAGMGERSEEHTSELQSLMRLPYAVFCLKKNKTKTGTPARSRLDTADHKQEIS